MSDDRKHTISPEFYQRELIRELEAENKALRDGRGVAVDELAQIIRTVDGKHDLGAGQLAERILFALSPTPAPLDAGGLA